MPASNELIGNRPLSGSELKQILIRDFTRMLDRDGMFQGHMGYRRAAFKIKLQMHLDNALYPEHTNEFTSRDPARNAKPPDTYIAAPPIKDAENDVVVGVEHEREINSPNATRLQEGMPVQVPSRDPSTGRIVEKPVVYDGAGVKEDNMSHKDISKETAAEWGL